jgi:hypothetical protein
MLYFLQIVGLGVMDEGITSHSVRLDWLLSDIYGAGHLEYQPAFALVGEDKWMFHDWSKMPDMSFTFTGLLPFTK